MRLCVNGHDKEVVGMVDGTRCKPCTQASRRKAWVKWYAKHGPVANRAKNRRSYIHNRERYLERQRKKYWGSEEVRNKKRALAKAWRDKQKALYGNEVNAFWARQVRNSL